MIVNLEQRPLTNAKGLGIFWVNLDKGLGDVAEQTHRAAAAGHGVPLVADAAGVEQKRMGCIESGDGQVWRDRNQSGPARRGVIAAIAEQPGAAIGVRRRDRPLDRLQSVILRRVEHAQAAEVEVALAVVFKAGEPRMFTEDLLGCVVVEGAPETERARHLGEDPPVGSGLARQRQKGTLARDATFGVGDGAILLAPGGRWQQHMGMLTGVGAPFAVGDDQKFAILQRLPHPVGLGQADGRVGAGDPERTHAAVGHRLEQLHRLESRLMRQCR